jgi:hypothetical protein
VHRRVYQSTLDVKKNGCVGMYNRMGTVYGRSLRVDMQVGPVVAA